jgi:hypothetical protein
MAGKPLTLLAVVELVLEELQGEFSFPRQRLY